MVQRFGGDVPSPEVETPGAMLQRLMRSAGLTTRDLAARASITMERLRRIEQRSTPFDEHEWRPLVLRIGQILVDVAVRPREVVTWILASGFTPLESHLTLPLLLDLEEVDPELSEALLYARALGRRACRKAMEVIGSAVQAPVAVAVTA